MQTKQNLPLKDRDYAGWTIELPITTSLRPSLKTKSACKSTKTCFKKHKQDSNSSIICIYTKLVTRDYEPTEFRKLNIISRKNICTTVLQAKVQEKKEIMGQESNLLNISKQIAIQENIYY